MNKISVVVVLLTSTLLLNCRVKTGTSSSSKPQPDIDLPQKEFLPVVLGAHQLGLLLPKLADKRVALVVNNTSLVGKTHLADTLLSSGVKLIKIFAPEHGFRGTADAGEQVKDGKDIRTGLPLISLYGANKKPTPEQMADIDVVVFDIQDVGVRFYTYISTMHYVMEACAENNKKMIVLDRPNPNGNYTDGPVLESSFKSFLGMHPIPLVHGLTVGELAMMINGEGWLNGGVKCELDIVKLRNWRHEDEYSLSEKPSPNLPNDQAIRLYPSLGLFEGTIMSVGRGTTFPFQVVGHPDLKDLSFAFTPESIPGMSKNPPYENKVCYGIDLRNVVAERKLDLKYLIDIYNAFPEKDKFFNSKSFDTHVGTSTLREQITRGVTEDDIRRSWEQALAAYNEKRKQYLFYP
ncbi:MAG TPA: DUF1343 domain-containing protein [Chryseosolibacter sp.]|nr:DUF1343 domain-containing protein [Chryseosolibacter sp.]